MLADSSIIKVLAGSGLWGGRNRGVGRHGHAFQQFFGHAGRNRLLLESHEVDFDTCPYQRANPDRISHAPRNLDQNHLFGEAEHGAAAEKKAQEAVAISGPPQMKIRSIDRGIPAAASNAMFIAGAEAHSVAAEADSVAAPVAFV
jgi:hypothetical protein